MNESEVNEKEVSASSFNKSPAENTQLSDQIDHEEPDEHLSRVQIELEKLNYANESINNLELELEESRREYVKTANETDSKLFNLEKKLGTCVEKAKPYYEARIELNEMRKNYLLAKNLFETAQELYVAAKNMQMYAEENLENFALGKSHDVQTGTGSGNYDKETLTKMLDIAKIKVNETELSKQSSDIEQIQAFKKYEEQRIKCLDMEKNLKKSIEKSREYFEEKSTLYEELRFLYTKIECLKSCLKEAKSNYQESLRNLESISTEIHEQRQSLDPSYSIPVRFDSKDIQSKLTSNSDSSLSSLSSLVSTSNQNKSAKSLDQSDVNFVKEEEDFDVYFQNEIHTDKDLKLSKSKNTSKNDDFTKIKDELIENLKLDNKLKIFKQKLDTNAQNFEKNNQNSKSVPNSPITSKIKVLFK